MTVYLTLDDMKAFFLENGGKVTNHALVNHFKSFLMNSQTKDESRAKFKQYVNQIATVRHENDIKYLILKNKYFPSTTVSNTDNEQATDSFKVLDTEQSSDITDTNLHYNHAITSSYNPSINKHTGNLIDENKESSKIMSIIETGARKLSNELHKTGDFNNLRPMCNDTVSVEHFSENDKINIRESSVEPGLLLNNYKNNGPQPIMDLNLNINEANYCKNKSNRHTNSITNALREPVDTTVEQDTDSNLSVKEKMQKFHKMAENTGRVSPTYIEKKDGLKQDQKNKDLWLVKAAQCDYQELVKLANENHCLPTVKDYATGYTALHWAAKAGDQNIAKLIAGTYKVNVNARTNGGYTPLHIAAQYGKDAFYDLLIKVYGADSNIRDYSGKKPHQYQHNMEAHALSQHSYHKIKLRKKNLDRDAGFLRIGSLNMRVRRTTEAVMTHFLGNSNSKPNYREPIIDYEFGTVYKDLDNLTFDGKNAKMNIQEGCPGSVKSWNSADDISQDII